MSEINLLEEEQQQPSKLFDWKTVVILIAIVGLTAGLVYMNNQVRELRGELAKVQQSVVDEVSNMRETTTAANNVNRQHLDGLRQELESARRQAAVAVGRAKEEALARTEQMAKELAEAEANNQKIVLGEIGEVRSASTAAHTRIGEVTQDVTNVKADVAATKSELEKTISELKRTNGDLGVMSGLIATNSRELDALKALGERDYIEFNLTKTKQPQKIGNMAVLLKKTDTKRNRYTVEVIADDKKIEKKDKTINEPVQFYMRNLRFPHEMVVNEVGRNQIRGYLSIPKSPVLRQMSELR